MSLDKRRRGPFGWLLADPLPKLLAIGLAVLLWFFVDSRIERTIGRPLPLAAVGEQRIAGDGSDRLALVLPTERVAPKGFFDGDRPIDRVEVFVSGPRFRTDAIENEPLNLQITAFLGLDWATRTSVEFTAADIRRDLLVLQGMTIELRPPRIRLDVERIDERPFQLNLDVVDLPEDAYAGRLRRETCEFSPSIAVVLGSAIGIEQFTRRPGKQFRALMKNSGNDRQVTASLEVIGGEELGLRFATTPLLTMQLRPQTSPFELELPVVVDDFALPPEQRGLYQPEPKTRVVRIKAGGVVRSELVGRAEGDDKRKQAEWAAANLRLYVHLPRPESGATYLPEVDREARLLLVGKGHEGVDRNECLLDEPVVVKLRRQP